ncbi:MAG TPA: hypothetical protein VNN79_09805 [Actinomycetota bacterium]|nr:hypothetical protein [Actinomycetota bacterium]
MAALALTATSNRVAGADMLSASMVSPSGGGDTFAPGADVFLRVQTNGTGLTATVLNANSNAGPNGTFLAQLAFTAIGATADRMFGPFPPSVFADPSDGQVHVSYSVVTAAKVGVYRFPQN